jgi:luciferase family oxidoreductase group 1
MTFSLSVLDLSPLPPDGDGAQALQNSISLAQQAEELGYHRFWLAEHHNMAGLAGVAPEVLIAAIAQRTARIRLGSGGVLLPNYAPLKVAELFRTLEALTPGRIDAGIGRAPNQDPRTALALRGDEAALKNADDIARLLSELEGFAQVGPSAFPPEHQLHEIVASPENVAFPPIFLLGSGQLSAQIAAARGRGFAAAYFFSPDESARAIAAYKAAFQPSPHFPQPHAILTVGVICADTDDEAEGYALASQLTALRRLNGVRAGFASVEEARAYQFSAEEQEQLRRFAPIVGGPERVRAQLVALVERIGADELMLATNVGDDAVRRRSYELLAETFALAGQPAG